MMKKVLTLMLMMSFVCLLLAGVGQAATVVPKLYLNGKVVQSEAEPLLVNSKTMIPIRVVSEELGYLVDWDNRAKKAAIKNGSTSIMLTVGIAEAVVNDVKTLLDAPAMIEDNVTYVPLRFVGENLGLDVYWDKPTKSVHLYGKPAAPPEEPANEPNVPEQGTDPEEVPTGDGDSEGNEPPVLPPVPADATGIIEDVSYDGFGRVTIRYDGELTPNAAFWSGTKLVIDVPYASLQPETIAALKQQKLSQVEQLVNAMALHKIRYSYYSNNPSTVRIVLDMTVQTEYAVLIESGAIHIDLLMEGIELPPLPGTEPEADKPFVVVIDAGHGGKDPGAPSVTGHWEKQFNLSVALKVDKLLKEEEKIKGYLTRSTDVFIELADRAKFANDLKADLFISIHANRYESHIRGTETYYNRADSFGLAQVMHKHLLKGTGLADRKVRKASFHVIRETTMPAVLLEAGYLSNSADAKALFTDSVQDRIAAEIVAGIKEYLKLG
jgi:N-acetylmuramoyl-L-alanine amidase